MSISNILVQLVASSFGIICILALTEWRFSKNTVVSASAAFIIGMSIVNFYVVRDLSYLLDDYYYLDFVYRICNIFLCVVLLAVLTKYKASKLIFTIFTVSVCVFIVDTLAISLRIWLGVFPLELALEILLYSSMIAAVIRIRKTFLHVIAYLDKRLFSLSVLPATLIVCFFLQISFPIPLVKKPANVPVALMLCCVSAVMYYIGFIMFKTMLAQSELEQNIKVMELNTISLEHQNEMALQNMKSAAMFRHDLRHVGQLILSCIDSGNLEEAKRLIRDTDSNIRQQSCLGSTREITGHKLLDAVLNYYAYYIKSLGIDIKMNMSPMNDIDVDSKELAVVLSNALENAVNACSKLESNTKRIIRLDGRPHGSQFFIEIVNSFEGEISFDPTTGLPVNTEQGHGYGSQSIAYFAQKNDAALEYYVSDNLFHMQMLL